MTWKKRLKLIARRLMLFLAIMGPGLITASADNDASGIATYSMAGSIYGYGFLWAILWVTFGEVVTQEMAARMGAVTGKGLTDLIRERFGVKLTFLVILGLALANWGTTAAQFAGVAASGELFGVSRYLMVPLAAFGVWFLVLRGSYKRVEKVLLLLCLYAVAYVMSAFMARPAWGEVLHHAIVPTFHVETRYLLALLATVGTTMTPWGCAYMQASVADKGVTMEEYPYTRMDVVVGAVAGNVVSAFVIICTAATLFTHGIHVETAEQAALALAPLAGQWAKQLFGLGMLGASLLAASVLPLATTYAVCEAFGWEHGIDRSPDEAPMFYAIYTALIVLSAAFVLIPRLPLFPLMWLSQVVNAVLLPAVLVFMLILANDGSLMKNWRNSRPTNVFAIVLSILVTIATFALLVAPLLTRG
jgi:NRAMP (natural resistance-associated macrophage protein)-like metal ion transporter